MSDDEDNKKKKGKKKAKKEKPISPEEIEAINSFEISKHLWPSELQELIDIVQAYKQRTFDEDIQLVEKHGGLDGIASKLKTSWKDGISANSV